MPPATAHSAGVATHRSGIPSRAPGRNASASAPRPGEVCFSVNSVLGALAEQLSIVRSMPRASSDENGVFIENRTFTDARAPATDAAPALTIFRLGQLLVYVYVAVRTARRGVEHSSVGHPESDAAEGSAAVGAGNFATIPKKIAPTSAAISTPIMVLTT